MARRYEVIVIRSEGMVIRSEEMALRGRLRSIAGRDVDTWTSVVLSRWLVMVVWYELMGTTRDAMTICEDRCHWSSLRMRHRSLLVSRCSLCVYHRMS